VPPARPNTPESIESSDSIDGTGYEFPPVPPNSPEPGEPNFSFSEVDYNNLEQVEPISSVEELIVFIFEMCPTRILEPQPQPLVQIPTPYNPERPLPPTPPNTPEPEVIESPVPDNKPSKPEPTETNSSVEISDNSIYEPYDIDLLDLESNLNQTDLNYFSFSNILELIIDLLNSI